MRNLTISALSTLLIINLAVVTACGPKTPTHKLGVYTAQADAALVAVTDSVDRLNRAGRIKPAAAKSVYQALQKIAGAVDLIRARAQSGYSKSDALTIITTTIEDVRKAEADGVIGLSGKEKEQFLKITFFAQFSLNSLKAVIEATKEPTAPGEAVTEAATARVNRAADETVWTDLVLILQTAVLRGISQSRMTQDEAFSDGAALSAELKASLALKISALGV